MRKLLILLMSVLFLPACSGNTNPREVVPASSQVEQEEDNTAELAEAEKKFKAETEEHEYIAIFRDEVPANTKVKFTGEIFAVGKVGFGGKFGLKQDIGETTEGVISVEDMIIGDKVEIVEGKTVTVYGFYDGKDDIGAPVIKALYIEE